MNGKRTAFLILVSLLSIIFICSLTKLIVTIRRSSGTVSKAEKKYVGGYYQAGSLRDVKPKDLDANLLTHIYYAFLNVNENGSLSIVAEKRGYYKDLVELKKVNPDLKLLFSVAQANNSFSIVAGDKVLRQTFAQNAYNIVQSNNYDGIDFDWEFPGNSDKENFIALLEETYTLFKKDGYLVTAAVSAIPSSSRYVVPEMTKYLDIINVMTYDYYGSWSTTTGAASPLYPSSLDSPYEKKYLSIEASVKNWVEAGASTNILAIGLPFYGRTFNLTDPSSHGIHANSSGAARPTTVTYYQILKSYQNFTTAWDEEQKSPYTYSGTTWISYEDERSIKIKAQYASDNGLLGTFSWHLGADDVFGEFSSVKQPLVRAMNDD